MDSVTVATAFADLVSLLGQFKSERGNRDAKTIADYLEWLRRRDHQQLVELIGQNTELANSISALLAGRHDEVMAKLEALDTVLSSVASRFADFHQFAVASHPDAVLSNQSISILRQMNAAESGCFLESVTNAGPTYHFYTGQRGQLEIKEPRFCEDDLAALCDLGLLRLEQADHNRLFHITRAGSKIGGDSQS